MLDTRIFQELLCYECFVEEAELLEREKERAEYVSVTQLEVWVVEGLDHLQQGSLLSETDFLDCELTPTAVVREDL